MTCQAVCGHLPGTHSCASLLTLLEDPKCGHKWATSDEPGQWAEALPRIMGEDTVTAPMLYLSSA